MSDHSKQPSNHTRSVTKTVLTLKENTQSQIVSPNSQMMHNKIAPHKSAKLGLSPLSNKPANPLPLSHNPMQSKQTKHQQPQTIHIITVKEQMVCILPTVLAHATPLYNTYISLSRIIIVRIIPLGFYNNNARRTCNSIKSASRQQLLLLQSQICCYAHNHRESIDSQSLTSTTKLMWPCSTNMEHRTIYMAVCQLHKE